MLSQHFRNSRDDVSPNRVPWKEYVLPVSTFSDGLQVLGRWGRTKRITSSVSTHIWTSLEKLIFHVQHAQTVDTRPFSFPLGVKLG